MSLKFVHENGKKARLRGTFNPAKPREPWQMIINKLYNTPVGNIFEKHQKLLRKMETNCQELTSKSLPLIDNKK